jgi:hypothetical protein
MNSELSEPLRELGTQLDQAWQRNAAARQRHATGIRAVIVVALASLAFVAGTLIAERPAPAVADMVITQIARSFAKSARGHLTSVSYVLTHRQAANHAASGNSADSNQPVYLVVLTGHFHYTIPRPADGSPTNKLNSTVETIIVDAANYQILDSGASDQRPNLTALGTVHTVPLPATD